MVTTTPVASWLKTGQRLRFVLIGAILLVGGFVWIAGHSASPDADADDSDSTAVLVAQHFIPAFSTLTAADVEVKNFPRGFVPPGALHNIRDLSGSKNQALFSSAIAIPEGQPISRALVNELTQSHGLSAILAPGKVAVSFEVDPVRGAGGWVRPGDTVAIYETPRDVSLKDLGSNKTELLFSAVSVIAVDQHRLGETSKAPANGLPPDPPESNANVLTVVLNPIEASALINAREKSQLSILLRPLGDDVAWPQ